MTPIISYKNFIQNARNKVAARKYLKSKILSLQMNISTAARFLKCSRKTIRYLLNSDDLDYESKKAPHSCPHKIPLNIEKLIVEYHKQSGYGPDMLKLNYNIIHSTSTIYRILLQNNLTRTHKKKVIRKSDVSKSKIKLKAFEKWQFDTKYLTDIPNLVGPIYQGLVPKYEYTLRDMKTGTTFLGFGLKERSVKDSCAFVALCLYHMQIHGIDTHYIRIQSDNGPEIIGREYKLDGYEIERTIEKFGARFKTIPVRRPTFNSHVESFHGRVEYEAYDRIKMDTLNSFSIKMIEYMYRWNTRRKQLKTRKTPMCIAKEHGYLLEECFYKFPIIFYDKISSYFTNPIYSPGHYLPDEVRKIYNPLHIIFTY
jgi:hypothetical protein